MIKIFSFLSAIFVFIAFMLFKTSNLEDHSIFFIDGQNVYKTVKNDGSFGDSPAFFIIEKIDILKKRIKTGEYLIKKNDSVLTVIKRILNEERVIRKITFPEGYTVKMIVENLNNNDLLFGKLEDIPKEGSLMPDTYFYYFGDSKQSIINKMQNQMKKTISDLGLSNNKINLNVDEVIILASIIEKETGIENERSLVSSVFHNRLQKNMRLQSDPTVIYAITNGYGILDRKLTREDWKFESKHNTYRNKGLPPTAICCPGVKSIYSAINPAKTDFLFFVADETGKKHNFSKDYEAHKKNIKNSKLKKS